MDPVFRAPMRSRVSDVPSGAGARYGLAHGVAGIGESAEGRIRRFGAAPAGGFVWTGTEDGAYWLGRLSGSLEPAGPAAQAAGLTHVRATDWLDRPFGEPEVPAGVAATFARGGRSFQRTHGDAVERAAAALWAAARDR
jgi:hypothetical protein